MSRRLRTLTTARIKADVREVIHHDGAPPARQTIERINAKVPEGMTYFRVGDSVNQYSVLPIKD